MRTYRALAVCLLAAACGPARAEAPPKPEEIVVVIFPFASPDGGKTGRTFAGRLRLRARRLNLVVVERLSLNEAMAGTKMPTLDTPPAEMATILTQRFGAKIGLWGEVRPEGSGFAMTFRGLNLNLSKDQLTIRDTRRADQPQLVNPVQDKVLLELTGRRKKPVPTATPRADAKAPTRGPELVRNGTFESGTKTPDGWQRIDGLTTFWAAGGVSGKCLRINTDVYHDQWVAWQKKVKAGATADQAPAPTPTSGPKYDTVAGIYGVAYDSAPIPVTPGKAYKVGIRYKGKSTDFFFPKLFIRGWADVGGEKRVVYDAYLPLRCASGGKAWESNVRLCQIPTDVQARIDYVVLKIYAYWPPGTFYFDNVSMKEVAR